MNYNISKYITSRVSTLILLIISMLTIASCHHDEPEPPAPKTASRTVLVYMLASNNGLGAMSPYDFDIQDIDEMCTAVARGDLGEGRLLVFHSNSKGNKVLKEITRTGVDTLYTYENDIVPQSSAVMSRVFADVKQLAPADDYGLVLWGHGSGWLEDGISDEAEAIMPLSFGSENNQRHKMNITSLARTLENQGFSFLYMDCCYMASVETIYQLRNAVPKVVAYSSEVLGWGMPYDENVKCFFKAKPDLRQAAQNTYDYYAMQRQPVYQMCCVSVINTAGMERLARATKAIYEQNSTGCPEGFEPQRFTTDMICRYFDFGSYVRSLQSDAELIDEYNQALDEVVELRLALKKLWGSLEINEHSGLTTFILETPYDADDKGYNRLDWYRDVASALID